MPIINGQHPRNPVWTSVSFPMSLDLLPETNQVMIGYGSGDQVPRVKLMAWQEVSALFPHVHHGSSELVRSWKWGHSGLLNRLHACLLMLCRCALLASILLKQMHARCCRC
jgi:hypothetical protein